MPASDAPTLHVYVDTLDADAGPVVAVHALTPVTPVIAQTPLPVGATAAAGPATVAVKVSVEPRVAVVEFAVTVTVGTAVITAVVDPEVGPVA